MRRERMDRADRNTACVLSVLGGVLVAVAVATMMGYIPSEAGKMGFSFISLCFSLVSLVYVIGVYNQIGTY